MKPAVARGYDSLAPEYNRQLAGDAWIRDQLWVHYGRVFRPGQQVLDVACGTGLDTLFLAQQGLTVSGLDISAGMLAQLRAGAEAAGVQERVRVVEGDVTRLREWPAGHFDGILSAFAGLNTVADLSQFAVDAARLLPARGHLIVHMLNRFSLWEWLGLVRRGRWRAAARLGSRRERLFTIGDETIPHRLYYPGEAYRAHFAPAFRLEACYGMGILRPPADQRIPAGGMVLLTALEGRLRDRRPFRRWGRFFVLDLVKR